ncbi:WecB/TagA/CpsF family glycosyltransferase [Microbulbifer sp. YPW1]|uniref:WecB/TagA/CpsF family glycosyltransferase n=1 Tax=Microbulbifer sp. YPW1 TaxID=2745199 RepID=UPI00159AF3D8|nr:WecB/TagA/CpsF family glycosyltransferase [Microbulbifer sp. YPW1]QKX16587.1 WecB/TagA/CpsF family glycosyltransferase [Microbulbifer sp. YPW1]
MHRKNLGRFYVDDVDTEYVFTFLRSNKSDEQRSYQYIVTPNIDHVQNIIKAPADDILIDIYKYAGLSLCDSRILQKILVMTGHGQTSLMTGSDLTVNIFERFLMKEDRVLIIGGTESVVDKVRKKYSGLCILHKNPSMGFINKPDEVANLARFCKEADADYIFLALGAPQQEIFAHKLADVLNKGVALCVGASLNFIAQEERRAPLWMQKLHCEWLFRLALNPRRLLKRYARNAFNLPSIVVFLRQAYIRPVKPIPGGY